MASSQGQSQSSSRKRTSFRLPLLNISGRSGRGLEQGPADVDEEKGQLPTGAAALPKDQPAAWPTWGFAYQGQEAATRVYRPMGEEEKEMSQTEGEGPKRKVPTISMRVILSDLGLSHLYRHFAQAGLQSIPKYKRIDDLEANTILELVGSCMPKGVTFTPDERCKIWKALRQQWYTAPEFQRVWTDPQTLPKISVPQKKGLVPLERSKAKRLKTDVSQLTTKGVRVRPTAETLRTGISEAEGQPEVIEVTPPPSFGYGPDTSLHYVHPDAELASEAGTEVGDTPLWEFDVLQRKPQEYFEMKDLQRCLNELMMVDPGELQREDPKENVLLARIRDLQTRMSAAILREKIRSRKRDWAVRFLIVLRTILSGLGFTMLAVAFLANRDVVPSLFFYFLCSSRHLWSATILIAGSVMLHGIKHYRRQNLRVARLKIVMRACRKLHQRILSFRLETEEQRIHEVDETIEALGQHFKDIAADASLFGITDTIQRAKSGKISRKPTAQQDGLAWQDTALEPIPETFGDLWRPPGERPQRKRGPATYQRKKKERSDYGRYVKDALVSDSQALPPIYPSRGRRQPYHRQGRARGRTAQVVPTSLVGSLGMPPEEEADTVDAATLGPGRPAQAQGIPEGDFLSSGLTSVGGSTISWSPGGTGAVGAAGGAGRSRRRPANFDDTGRYEHQRRAWVPPPPRVSKDVSIAGRPRDDARLMDEGDGLREGDDWDDLLDASS